MKRLLIAALTFLGLASAVQAAPIWGTVQIGTSTTLVPTLQAGGINISSGNIRNLTVSTATVSKLTVSSITIDAFTVNAATATNLTSTNFNASTGSVTNFITTRSTDTNHTFTTGNGTTLSLTTLVGSSVTTSDFSATRSTSTFMNVSTFTLAGELKIGAAQSTSGQMLLSAGPGLAPFFSRNGRILQIISTSTTVNKTTTSSGFSDTGLQYTGFTPMASNSKILIWTSQPFTVSGSAATYCEGRMTRDSTDLPPADSDGIMVVSQSNAEEGGMYSLHATDTPGAGTFTYKTRFARFTGSGTCIAQTNTSGNPGNKAGMLIMEVGQ